jgi:oligopeptide/dipeptide ABC transporter ATP-binding protein
VTHDLGVIADLCDRVAVMYAGQIVEQAPVHDLFARPQHPYTEGLLNAMPQIGAAGEPLYAIPGQVPQPDAWPDGCRFAPRCPYAQDACVAAPVELLGPREAHRADPDRADHLARCVRRAELTLRGAE